MIVNFHSPLVDERPLTPRRLSTAAVNGTSPKTRRRDDAEAAVIHIQWPCITSFHIVPEMISFSLTFDGRSGQTVRTNLHRHEIVLKAEYKIKLYLAA